MPLSLCFNASGRGGLAHDTGRDPWSDSGMVINATLLALLEVVANETPKLARQLADNIGTAVQQSRHVVLRDAWTRRRRRFQMEFETSLSPRLAQARQGLDPFRRRVVNLDQLSLVDEHQALQDVGVNYAAKVCQEAFSTELFQLSNFFTALEGIQHGREPNWLRPALFAHAMAEALAGHDISAEQHYNFMQAASPALANALVPLYQALIARLREDKVAQMVSSSSPGRQTPRNLAALHERVESRPAHGAEETLLPGMRSQGLLNQLYARVLADPALTPPIKAELSKLQLAMERLSVIDPSLLRDQSHPAWRLINAVAAYGSTFTDAKDPRLQEFIAFLSQQTAALNQAPAPSVQQFDGLRRLIDAFIARQVRTLQNQPSAQELAKMARERQRPTWTQLVHDQLEAELTDVPISSSLRRFLTGPWVNAIVQRMVLDGEDAPSVQAHIDLVDELIDSLMPLPDEAAREQLRLRLPDLIRRLEVGMESVHFNPAQRSAVFNELMTLHGRVLRGKGLGVPSAQSAGGPDSQHDSRHHSRPSGQNSRLDAQSSLQGLLAERHSEFSSVWASADVDRSMLPTQPQGLQDGDAERADQRWLSHLHVGHWLHLMVHGHWRTSQLAWISEDGEFYLFVGQDENDRQSITRGALRQLYRSGLAINLEQEGVVERAIQALMHDLK